MAPTAAAGDRELGKRLLSRVWAWSRATVTRCRTLGLAARCCMRSARRCREPSPLSKSVGAGSQAFADVVVVDRVSVHGRA